MSLVCAYKISSVFGSKGKSGFAVIFRKLEVSCGSFHVTVLVGSPAAGSCAVLDQQRQSESSSRAVHSASPALPLCSGPNADEPISPARGAGQQSHDFPLGSSVKESKPCPVERDRSLHRMVGCVIRMSQASIPVVWSSESRDCRERWR